MKKFFGLFVQQLVALAPIYLIVFLTLATFVTYFTVEEVATGVASVLSFLTHTWDVILGVFL